MDKAKKACLEKFYRLWREHLEYGGSYKWHCENSGKEHSKEWRVGSCRHPIGLGLFRFFGDVFKEPFKDWWERMGDNVCAINDDPKEYIRFAKDMFYNQPGKANGVAYLEPHPEALVKNPVYENAVDAIVEIIDDLNEQSHKISGQDVTIKDLKLALSFSLKHDYRFAYLRVNLLEVWLKDRAPELHLKRMIKEKGIEHHFNSLQALTFLPSANKLGHVERCLEVYKASLSVRNIPALIRKVGTKAEKKTGLMIVPSGFNTKGWLERPKKQSKMPRPAISLAHVRHTPLQKDFPSLRPLWISVKQDNSRHLSCFINMSKFSKLSLTRPPIPPYPSGTIWM